MVYESDFYTTRRPYSRPTISTYSVTRRQIPWDKLLDAPRPSQVPPVYTAFGKVGKYELDKTRKPQPRPSGHVSVGLPTGVQSVYPRRYPKVTPSQGPGEPHQVLISRKYAPRRVTFEEQRDKSAVKLAGDEFVEKLLSGEQAVAATPVPQYSNTYEGPLKFYSTYYHA